MAANAPEIRDHKEWLGYLQPVGLVVSPLALVRSQAIVNRNVVELQQKLLSHIHREDEGVELASRPYIREFVSFVEDVLGWDGEQDLVSPDDEPELLEKLEVVLPEYGETLRPTYVVPDVPEDGEEEEKWLMLINVLLPGEDMDATFDARPARGWHASPHARLERLLRETENPLGLLYNGTDIRIVYAPRGETSGHLTFPVDAMCEVSGRLILSALHMLLEADRLFTMAKERRLLSLLAESRQYQNEVSNKLADQVLHALIELLRGFQSADAAAKGALFSPIPPEDKQHIYGGLLTTLLRMVFLLYAEDRGLMPSHDVYVKYYSVSGLFDRLREDMGQYPDTIDQRYGAWAQLLSLFRLVYDGGNHKNMHLPPRHGQLFDPDEYPFLEGRPYATHRVLGDRLQPPRVSDGVVYRILENLLIVDGERLSYRSLDVEQIGSVYESMMGFSIEMAEGDSIGVTPDHVVVNLEELLDVKPASRKKELKAWSGCDIGKGEGAKLLKGATTAEELVAALGKKVSSRTPRILAAGSLFLQPGEERRRSGSHYTPRSLTEPIVETTLRPVLEALGDNPTPDQILDLKVCDPAMGSGAFLVEACRQLAEKLVESWERHNMLLSRSQDSLPAVSTTVRGQDEPNSGEWVKVPADEDPLLHARRLVAQRCLYGVDKNPFAVNLAKLSLWLVTLAREHSFTFLDHALKHGDSLVGLTKRQIAGFHWDDKQIKQITFGEFVDEKVKEAAKRRAEIHALGDEDEHLKRMNWKEAEEALDDVRLIGDLIIHAFFSEDKKKQKEEARMRLQDQSQIWWQGEGEGDVLRLKTSIEEIKMDLSHPVVPFHWEVEFPEVFERTNGGFDGFVGNPPFAGKNTIIAGHIPGYLEWLKVAHEESHGNSDLVAHFFRRAYDLLRQNRAFGLIATNTIGQGDTRYTGLRHIRKHNGIIYSATRRFPWPGQAAVTVSVVHIFKGEYCGPILLDKRVVEQITAYLFHEGPDDDPNKLLSNSGICFVGVQVHGLGLTFDDTATAKGANPTSEIVRLVEKNPKNREVIKPLMGWKEITSSPTHTPIRSVIDFSNFSEEEARQWPELMEILEQKVKPGRLKDNRAAYRKYWWQFAEKRPELSNKKENIEYVLVTSAKATSHLSFVRLPSEIVFTNATNVLIVSSFSIFSFLQSRVHDIWARFCGSSLEDRLTYTSSTCFETFPFPDAWEESQTLEEVGERYYNFRLKAMDKNDEGLTKTYNRFSDPHENDPDILHLRDLHSDLDNAVLAAYGWSDLSTECSFLLDYEDDGRGQKKPWRYRWSNEVRDSVLARLLDLNARRAKEEKQAGLEAQTAKKKKNTKKKSKSSKKKKPADDLPLWSASED